MTEALIAELAQLRFNDLTALAKHLRGGTLGFDPNRKFSRPMKENFARWIVFEFDASAIRGAMAEAPGSAGAADESSEPQREAGPFDSATFADNPPGSYHNDQRGGGNADAVAQAIARALAGLQVGVDAGTVGRIVDGRLEGLSERIRKAAHETVAKAVAELTLPRPIEIVRKEPDGTETRENMGVQHKQFERLLKLCGMRGIDGNALNIWLAGPAGSGKTTAARNVAKALGRKFYFNGAVDTEYKLLGFTDAQGRVVSRPFREAFEHGGVYLFDEVDASMPGALLAFNAATSNGTCDFPDGNIPRHPDCVIIAAANTFGQGATNEYVGRMKQDAAFLDRFVQLAWKYDEKLEITLSGNEQWARKVQRVRKAVGELGIRHIVSPRATYFGATMLAYGEAEADVIDMVLRKGLSYDQWKQVRTKASL